MDATTFSRIPSASASLSIVFAGTMAWDFGPLCPRLMAF